MAKKKKKETKTKRKGPIVGNEYKGKGIYKGNGMYINK